MNRDEQLSLLRATAEVVRRSGSSREVTQLSAEESRRKLMRSEEEIEREAPRLLVAG